MAKMLSNDALADLLKMHEPERYVICASTPAKESSILEIVDECETGDKFCAASLPQPLERVREDEWKRKWRDLKRIEEEKKK